MKKRAAVFIDGVFFTKINEVIRGKNQQKNLIIKNFISEIKDAIEICENEKIEIKQIDFFKGKFSINQLKIIYKNDEQKVNSHLYRERMLEDILSQNNITIHNQQATVRKGGELVEKGIDVSIAIEAVEINNIDYFILISGDQDFVPLIRKLKRKNIKTATIEVDLISDNRNIVKTSNNILPVYDIVINLNAILKDEVKMKHLITIDNGKE